MDSQHHIRDSNVLKVGLLRVWEVHLRLPQHLDQHGIVKVDGAFEGVVEEPKLQPPLPQVQVHRVVLRDDN